MTHVPSVRPLQPLVCNLIQLTPIVSYPATQAKSIRQYEVDPGLILIRTISTFVIAFFALGVLALTYPGGASLAGKYVFRSFLGLALLTLTVAGIEFWRAKYAVAVLDRARLCICLGREFDKRGQPEKALEAWQSALNMYRNVHGSKHFDLVVSLSYIGAALRVLGRPQEALYSCKQSMEMQIELPLAGFPRGINGIPEGITREHRLLITAETCQTGGSVFQELKDNEDALSCFMQALEFRKEFLENNHPDVVESSNSVAATLRALGREEEALKYDVQRASSPEL